ncbi:MAG TPA: MarR family transcriptional regulator [Candidatus Limnocylindria bacterium]|nr:MarR family transcriptional regulator [Candidatus Limnocylindria bacterium]
MSSSRSAPAADDPRLDAWRAFLFAHAHVRRQLERELQAEQGMSLAEYEVLLVLAYSPEQRRRMSELADLIFLSRSGATRLVDRLQADRLVERVSCDTDRRGQWAQLTRAGYQRLRSASPTHLRGIAEHFLDRIPAAELDGLQATLERVVTEPIPSMRRPAPAG